MEGEQQPPAAAGRTTCAVHDIVAGDDGRCVLCRRDEQPTGKPWPIVQIFGVIAAICGIALVAYGVVKYSSLGQTDPEVIAEPSFAGEEPGGEEEPVDGHPAREPADDSLRGAAAAQDEDGELQGDDPTAASSIECRGCGTSTDRPVEEAGALRAEMRRVPIEMYMTQWCPHCTRARAWLKANGYRFTEYDVEADDSARRRRDRLNPRKGVPVFDIDGEVLVGFSPESVESRLRRAAKRRMDW